MDTNKTLSSCFNTIFPVLSVMIFALIYAVIFDTFNLDLVTSFYNIFLALPIFALCLVITRRYHIAVIAASTVVFAMFYIDQYVFSVRLTHIRFSDLKLVDQAIHVANRYSPVWNIEIMRRLLIAAALCFFLVFLVLYYKPKYHLRTAFLVGIGLCIVSLGPILCGVLPSDTEDFDFSTISERRGLLKRRCQAPRWKCDILFRISTPVNMTG